MNKKQFYVYQEDLIKYKSNKVPVTISNLVQEFNERFCSAEMKRLRTENITDFLIKQRYLYLDKDGAKRPTEKGKWLGISTQKIANENGKEYLMNMYNSRAQKYIFDNIYEII